MGLGFIMPARHAVSRFSPSAVHEISHCGAVVGLPPHAGEALTFARTKVSKMRYMPLQPRALTATGDTGHTPLCGHPDLLRKSCSRALITGWTSCETLQRSMRQCRDYGLIYKRNVSFLLMYLYRSIEKTTNLHPIILNHGHVSRIPEGN